MSTLLPIMVFIVLAVLCIVLLFVFADKKEEIKVVDILLYTIPALILLVGIGLIGTIGAIDVSGKVPARDLGLLILLGILVVSVLHTWLINRRKKYKLLSKLLFTLFLGFLGAAMLVLIFGVKGYDEIPSETYRFNYIGSLLLLIVPFAIIQASEVYITGRPYIPKPKACYPANGLHVPQLDFTTTVPLRLVFAPKPNEKTASFSRKLPTHNTIKIVIYAFWDSLKEENIFVKSAAEGKDEMHFCWRFYVKKYRLLPFKRIIDPNRTADENKIKPKSFLIAKRIYQ